MKKTIALLIAASMLLTSCVNTAVPGKSQPDESTPYPAHGSSVTSCGFDLNNLNYDPRPGIIDSTMRIAGEISPYMGERWASAPKVCMHEEYTYLIRSYPEEITSAEEYEAYVSSGGKVHEIEVYENHDYSNPVRIIPLTGLDNMYFSVWEISYNPDDSNFYLLMNTAEDWSETGEYSLILYKFSPEGEYIASSPISKNNDARYLINKGEVYYIDNGGWSGRTGKLICEDPFAGTVEVIRDSALTVSFSNYVMYYTNIWRVDGEGFDAAIFTIDQETGEEIQLSRLKPEVKRLEGEVYVSDACWDDANDTLYVSFGHTLHAVKNGESKNVITTYNSSVYPVAVSDKYLMVKVGNSQSAVYFTEAEHESITVNNLDLNICYYYPSSAYVNYDVVTGIFRETIETMNASGISVTFNISYITDDIDEYVNTMAKKLLAGDTDYDLFFVADETPTLLQGRYFEDLGSYDVLADRFDYMIPGLEELMSVDGKRALMPINRVLVTSMATRSTALGEAQDSPKTYDEFFRYHDTAAEMLPDDAYYFGFGSPFSVYSEWLYEIYSNFMAHTISDETAKSDLLRIFSDMTTLDRYELIVSTREEYDAKKDWKVAWEFLPNNGESYGGFYKAFPKMNDSYKYCAQFDAFGINPNSPNKELAAAFLAYRMNALDDGDFMNLLFTDTAENHARYKETLAQNRYQSFKEQLADSIRYTYNDDFSGLCLELGNELQSGEITPEEAAAEAYRFMKMVRDE